MEIKPSLYRFATEEHKKEFEQLQAENEGLKKTLQHLDICLLIMANAKSEEGIRGLPELSTELRKYIEQAL